SDNFNRATFMRANLYPAAAVLNIGNDILFNEEKIKVDRITGHGGLFKTKGVGQRILSAALNSPISVMETAGEGGAWGMALLAGYLVNNPDKKTLPDYLDTVVFGGNAGESIMATPEEVEGFNRYIKNYIDCLPIEKKAVECKK
ncbi:MAG: ATPase, partial [Muribaculaceae bacterium]|nr:ATPase [Muribaculaceae bacterium]